MDDDEDFKALFFSEARELLEALLEHLNLLADDAGDSETVHAAFRAVHSVKGGAAAFGFDSLIGFAHVFETVMDRIREDELALDEHVTQILLRSADMMNMLVENAEADAETEVEGMRRLQQELEQLTGAEPTKPVADTAGAASMPDGPSDVDDAAAEASEAALQDPAEPATCEMICRMAPDEEFFQAGHDMLRLIRSGRDLGLAEVHAEGEVPPLAEFDPRRCPLSWELIFRTEKSPAEIENFFAIYGHMAQFDFFGPGGDDDEDDADAAPGSGIAADSQGETASAAAADAPVGAAGGDALPPSPPKTGGAGGERGRAGGDMAKSLRVEITRIDRLVNLVGEMLITQAALAQQLSEGPEDSQISDMAYSVENMSRQLRELQESVMAIRAQPVKSVFRRMPRVIRDLGDKLTKQVKLTLEGEHTEVDATVIEELSEPLVHMLRNSMDHGLEPNDEREALGKPRVGLIRLAAEHRGERVIITIEDDGRGVNRERVLTKARERGLISSDDQLIPEDIDMLIFHPGFSTASEVSSVSGRGVGMDVVKKKITSLGGRVTMVSTPGKGTKFTITLPLTLAVMDGMTIGVGDQKYILPLSTVVEALSVPRGEGKVLPDGTCVLQRRGEYLPLMSLRGALNMPDRDVDEEMAIVVDTETAGHVALTVDELIGQRQIVLKSLEANFQKVQGISGATILGDGQVALILDVPALMRLGGVGQGQEMFH